VSTRQYGAIPGSDQIVDRLVSIAEDLADLALQRLQQAVDETRGTPGSLACDGNTVKLAADKLAAEERRLTRARRAVERAVVVLSGDGDDG